MIKKMVQAAITAERMIVSFDFFLLMAPANKNVFNCYGVGIGSNSREHTMMPAESLMSNARNWGSIDYQGGLGPQGIFHPTA